MGKVNALINGVGIWEGEKIVQKKIVRQNQSCLFELDWSMSLY
jgi:hypothetical protein